MFKMPLLSAALLFASMQFQVLLATDWKQSMGPAMTGVTSEEISPGAVSGPDAPSTIWRAEAGMGGASPVVVGEVVYAIGAFNHGEEPSASATPGRILSHWGPGTKDAQGKRVYHDADIYVSAFSAKDGSVLWRTKVSHEGITDLLLPNASPLFADGRLFVRTPRHAVALDATTGKVLWNFEFTERYGAQEFWMQGRSAPIMAGGNVIYTNIVAQSVSAGGFPQGNQAQCLALNPETGEMVWQHIASPNHRGAFDSGNPQNESGYMGWEPVTAFGEVDAQPTIVMSTGHAAIGLDPGSGTRRWIFHHAMELEYIRKWINDRDSTTKPNPWQWWVGYGYTPPQVVVDNGVVVERLFLGHGTLGTSLAAFEVKDGKPELLWTTDQLQSRNAKFITHKGKLYGMDLHGHLHTVGKGQIQEWPRPRRPQEVKQFQCRDLRTGVLIWSSDVLRQSDTKPRTFYLCEKPPQGVKPCPALTESLRQELEEGNYSYQGDPTYILAGDILVLKAARESFSGLQFAKVSESGLQKIGERAFPLGQQSHGEPVVAGGRLFIKLYNNKNNFEGLGGTLVAFDVSK